MDEKQDRATIFHRHRENIYFRWGLTAFLVIVACVIVAQVVIKLTAVFAILGRLLRAIAPILYGMGIAYLLDPIVSRIEVFLKPKLRPYMNRSAETVSRAIGVCVSLILVFLAAWALLSMVLPQLLESINAILGSLPTYYNTLSDWVMAQIDDNIEMADFTGDVMDTVYAYFSNWLTTSLLPRAQAIMLTFTTSVVSMAKAALYLVVGLIISVYLLMGKRRFLAQAKKLCYGFLGEKKGGYVCNVCTYANHAYGGFIGGKIIDSIIMGLLCFLGMQIMKMPYALLISIIVGTTNIIPFFGPFLGAIPSALLLLVINPLQCLYFLIFALILQQLDGNIIGPLILGDATGLDGFWVVMSILVFGSFFGVLGMIIAAPTFSVIYKIIAEVTNWMLTNHGLSTVTTDYENWNYPPRAESSHWKKPVSRMTRRKETKHKQSDPTQESQQMTADENGGEE